MKRIGAFTAILAAVFAAGPSFAQPGGGIEPVGNVRLGVPSFDVRLSMGFNYDLLRSLTNVSFDYPVGYFGFNIPFPFSAGLSDFLDEKSIDSIFGNEKIFRRGNKFNPTAGASQNANYTVRVDVPMVGGVGSFAYTQNFFMNFSTALGGSSLIETFRPINEVLDNGGGAAPGSIDGFLAVRGALRLPLSVSMGWETMTFGYAYRVNNNDDLVFALNLHRHLFSVDVRLKADIDILGHANITARNVDMGDGAFMSIGIDEELINFNSDKCNGLAQGRFRAEAWTPSVGVKWKRFSLNSRFGLNTKAKGSAVGGFVVPRVVDLETGDLTLGAKFESFSDSLGANPLYVFKTFGEGGGLIPNEIDSITYEIRDAFRWKMPQGHTLAFDIVPNKMSVSYTKLFGELAMKMDNIIRTTNVRSEDSSSWLAGKNDTLSVDLGVAADHILLFNLTYPSFFMNVGFGGLDARSNQNYALRDNKALKSLRVGDVVMVLPIVSGGLNLGTKLQLRLEADILPLPAVRSGVNYYF
ncbi:MAG: hypothetical protein LBH93_05895 [Chitinispirillales bacterium]|jgi:hypothetical protein|nr:hypothetical protein [Chitinispirillales bacterium]